MIGVLTTHHCHNGLLPSLVAPSQDAEMAWQNTSSFPLCPDHRPGPTLMSARPDLCGGYRVSGIPTAIIVKYLRSILVSARSSPPLIEVHEDANTLVRR